MSSMYKGKKRFDREQLVFIADVMITSFVDTVESRLPQAPGDLQVFLTRKDAFNTFHDGALESLGWNLSILFAQVTESAGIGDGMGVSDALHYLGDFIAPLIKQRTSGRWKGFKEGGKIHTINTRKLAVLFVDAVFNVKSDDYLNLSPFDKDGFDADGYDADGYDAEGLDRGGRDRDGTRKSYDA